MIEIPEHIKLILSGADCAGPASEELVNSVERDLRLTFPAQYRAFLRHCGAALFVGFEIYGLVDSRSSDAPPMWSDLRDVARSRSRSGMLEELLPISDNGGDYAFYLTTDKTKNVAAESVVVYGPGRDGAQISASFFEFIEQATSQGMSSLVQ
jgi:hypothetical protein